MVIEVYVYTITNWNGVHIHRLMLSRDENKYIQQATNTPIVQLHLFLHYLYSQATSNQAIP